jgi:hypothetical protein
MRRLIILLLLAGAAGWAALHHYRQQNQLHQQLEQLTALLTAENAWVSRNAQNTVKSIEEAAAKNRDQPADLALLRRAEALQTRANNLVATLRTNGDQLRRATGNQEARPLQHLGAAIGAGWNQDGPRRQAFAQQLATYADTLRHFDTAEAAKPPLATPTFTNDTPIVEALADLARLESEILACQTQALQRLSTRVGARRWLVHPLAIATATSSVVAPGGTYRAQLGLIDYFSANELNMRMTCNGQPVPLTPAGTGLVRFRAPTHPGPAAWTGTIRVSSNNRDSTFSVTVPYRVARR